MILKKLPLILASCTLFSFSACIQDEPLNAECDIISVDTAWINNNRDILIGSPIITNNSVSFNIQKGSNRSELNPLFNLTPGTTLGTLKDGVITEANGMARDFSSPQIYTAFSEDGNWQKDYTVSFNYPQPITLCGFEYFQLDQSNRYHTWFEIDKEDKANPRRDYWATGNAGYALTGMGKQPSDYPTTAETNGYRGNCVKLATRSTGSFGAGVNMPIAAGSIFIGEFRASQAMLFPLKATRFGLQLVGGKPLFLTGFYKYSAGKVFTNGKGEVDNTKKDTCDIYAVLFEVEPHNMVTLNGANILNSDRIVALARIDDPGEPQEWKRFVEPFRQMNGKTFSEERLRNDGYAITIVATSSRQGAFFEGAVGSVLYADELRIVWEGDKDEDDFTK